MRINEPYMSYYRDLYRESPVWKGQDGRLIIYCEQGNGDQIMFARYFRKLKNQLILHCNPSLNKLFSQIPNVIGFIDKPNAEMLQEHDYHFLSLDLPDYLGSYDAEIPYLFAEPLKDLGTEYKIGICWEGSETNDNNETRSCHLKYFKPLQKEGVKLFSLQNKVTEPFWDKDIELFGVEINDYYDTARLISSMDLVISVDTSVLHLAGALGKKTIGLLSKDYDKRWDKVWYPSIKLIQGDFEKILNGKDILKLFS